MIIFILILLFLLFFLFGAISLAPFVPTFSKDLTRINKQSDLKPGDTFVEIGSGSGKVSMYIAKHNPEANIIGIELNLILFLYSKIKSFLFGTKNLNIKFANALKYDFSNVNVAYIFGLPETVSGKIMFKLYKELPMNSKYISYIFKIKNRQGKCIKIKENKMDNSIYICTK